MVISVIRIVATAEAKRRSFVEISENLPNVGHAWLLMDILCIQQKEGQVIGDQLFDSAYDRNGVLEDYLFTLASRGYIQITRLNHPMRGCVLSHYSKNSAHLYNLQGYE